MSVTSQTTIDYPQLRQIAQQQGLNLVAALPRHIVDSVLQRESAYLQEWQQRGYAGEMGYMSRATDLFASLSQILPETKSVLCFLIPYCPPSQSRSADVPYGYGRIARYAWGRDYHQQLRDCLEVFVKNVADTFAKDRIHYRCFSDAVPILERSLARAAGLGFIGRNTLLIRPNYGSFCFLAEVLWDQEISQIPVPEVHTSTTPGSGCGSCTRCLSACPTAAFPASGILDARRCISYLTIEKRTDFDEWESTAIDNWLFGCDVCQDVCPFNHPGVQSQCPDEFSPEKGAGELLLLEELLAIPDDRAFAERYSHSALMRPGRSGMLRNAISVVANTQVRELIPQLRNLARSDEAEVVRITARKALSRMG